jgi:hypothetical protein
MVICCTRVATGTYGKRRLIPCLAPASEGTGWGDGEAIHVAPASLGSWRCPGVVRGCLLGTGQDRCEWHVSGTASEGDLAPRMPLATSLTVGWAVLGGHRIVAKPRTRRGSVLPHQ